MAVDHGWIFRRARFYRGAIQEEDERAGARDLLLAMAASPDWTGYRYVALRTAARLLPHGRETASFQKVRQEAAALADLDPGFAGLRAKIHNAPEAKDADRVREHAAKARKDLRPRYEALAAEIDAAYAPVPLADTLEGTAGTMRAAEARDKLRAEAQRQRQAASDTERYQSTAAILAGLRDAVGRVRGAGDRLRLVDLSLAVEDENFRLGTLLRPGLPSLARAAQVPLLRAGAEAAYGAGFVNTRQRRALAAACDALAAPELRLDDYHERLHEVALLPGWATQSLRMHFYEPSQKLAEIEPRADVFLQDQVRGGALFFYSEVLDELMKDADRLAGVERRLFGKSVGTGLSALNPGLARGILHTTADTRQPESFRRDGIYLLPETVADLPPVAGILTRGAGNPLSHVQLLARNLGIPNVSVGASLVDTLREHDGKRVVLAVSPKGVVQLEEDSPRWEAAFGTGAAPTAGVLITARPAEARPLGPRLPEPRRAAGERLRAHRRPEGGQARRAAPRVPGGDGARRRDPVRPVPGGGARPAAPAERQDRLRVDGLRVPAYRGDAAGIARRSRRPPRPCAPRSTTSSARRTPAPTSGGG